MDDIDEIYNYLDSIYNALDNSYTLEYKKQVLQSVKNKFDFNATMVRNVCNINENKYGLYGRTTIANLSLEDTNKNLMAYAEVITNMIRANRVDFPSIRAINTIYYNNNTFNRNLVVYRSFKGQLTVEDLLNICGYLIQYIEINYDINLEEYSLAIDEFKEINEILNNNQRTKPRNKALHYTNKLLKEVYKDTQDDKETNRMSLLLDLTIDFFVND